MTDPEIVVLRLPLSYGLKATDLTIERRQSSTTDDLGDGVMGYIADNISWSDDEVLERIFRHAIILFHSEKGTFGECLDTALTWEVG